jgi:hypothetical protein
MQSEVPSGGALEASPASPLQRGLPSPSRSARRARPGPERSSRESAEIAVARGADYATIPVAAAMTGYSAKAIRRKIEAGVWLEGREFRRAPDGHVLISVKGYELWVERGRA